MTKINTGIVNEAGNYVTNFLEDQLPDSITFHTIDHAKSVVDSAEYIGKNRFAHHVYKKMMILNSIFYCPLLF